jgi:hypothetical protein
VFHRGISILSPNVHGSRLRGRIDAFLHHDSPSAALETMTEQGTRPGTVVGNRRLYVSRTSQWFGRSLQPLDRSLDVIGVSKDSGRWFGDRATPFGPRQRDAVAVATTTDDSAAVAL